MRKADETRDAGGSRGRARMPGEARGAPGPGSGDGGNGERGRGFGKALPIALIQEKRMIAVRFVKAEAGHRNLCVQFEFASVCENLFKIS